MKNNTLIAVTILIILILLGYYFRGNIKDYFNNVEKIDTVFHTDTFYKDTTIWKYQPVIKEKIIQKTDTFYKKDGTDTVLVKASNKYQDTIICAKDTMEVTSYISGYDAKLDSLKVRLSKQEIIKTVEITKYITPKMTLKDHFKVGVGLGYGIGLKNKDIEPFIGISLNYNF